MSAPEYVPGNSTNQVQGYQSPPRREDAWFANRPGEVDTQPEGSRLGSAGPDQGFAYKLVSLFDDRLILGGVDRDDAVEGCVAVAMKRASLFGRAPVVHDLNVAFTIYGFLTDTPTPELVDFRAELFEEVRNSHHYMELRQVVDAVDSTCLKKTPDQVSALCAEDWSSAFVL